MQGDALLGLLLREVEPALARQADGPALARGPRRAAAVRDLVQLPPEFIFARERARIEQLHEDGRAPPFLRVGAAMPRETARQRFDQA